MSILRRLASAAIELLAPRTCPGCDLELTSHARSAADGPAAWFCAACAPLIERPAEALWPPAEVGAAFSYAGPLADAIVRFKYAGRSDLGEPLGRLLAQAALPYAGLVECVVPLPLHPRKLSNRGYNQSALLAVHVSRALGACMSTSVLVRRREASPQAGRSRDERARNVRGAFHALRASSAVLLIDDVRTSGATLAEASRALRDAGCTSVRSLCLAAAPA